MKQEIRRIILIVVAAIFVVAGVIGLFLPFLQGVLFLLVGLILLSIASPTLRDWTERHTRRYPRVHAMIEKLRARIVRIIGE